MYSTATKSEIEVIKTQHSRIQDVDFTNLPFGRIFSDHMFIMDYSNGAWQHPQIRPYENFSFSPSISALHYGQAIFEGMKAYKNKNGEAFLFRPEMNHTRLNHSAQRMCMPQVPKELFMDALMKLIALDKNWIPDDDGSSLYIRPYMFATDEFVGIKPSETYRFCIFTCPVGRYYSEPVRVRIEPYYSRAVEGGTGTAKAAGNYGGALYPAKQCQDAGFHQLVWTDAKEHKYIEESGTMNVMFMIDNKIITPELTGTILNGITRNSVLTVLRDWDIQVEERKVSVEEVVNAARNGKLQDAFGVGTAATIAQIKIIGYKDDKFELSDLATRELSNKLVDYFDSYRRGLEADKFGWMVRIP